MAFTDECPRALPGDPVAVAGIHRLKDKATDEAERYLQGVGDEAATVMSDLRFQISLNGLRLKIESVSHAYLHSYRFRALTSRERLGDTPCERELARKSLVPSQVGSRSGRR